MANEIINPKIATCYLQRTTISNFAFFFKNNNKPCIFHENRLLVDDSYEISYLIFLKI